MEWVYLQSAFVRHYQGSIFSLSKDSLLQVPYVYEEKVPPMDNHFYHLPDNGVGVPARLPVWNTKLIANEELKDFDLTGGPLRVTYVSAGLYDGFIDNYLSLPFPQGKGSVKIIKNTKGEAHLIQLPDYLGHWVEEVSIINRQSGEFIQFKCFDKKEMIVDGAHWPVGFYTILITNLRGEHEYLHCLKCFPVYVETSLGSKKIFKHTVW
jgi:hypothetical protein